jgi:succinoglycan biosynthesis transport protein ExoP
MSLPTVTQLPVARQSHELAEPVYYAPPPPPVEDDGGLDLKRILGAVKRRKFFILAVVLLLTGLAYLFIRQITPIYEAKVTLLVEGERMQLIEADRVILNQDPDLVTRETEAAVLRSRQVATQVVRDLDLTSNPLFNPTLVEQKDSILDSIIGGITSLFGGGGEAQAGAEDALAARLAAAGGDPAVLAAPLSPEEIEKITVDNFLAGLEVKPSDRARVIEVVYSSSDRFLAAQLANAVVRTYITGQIEERSSVVSEAGAWLDERVREAEARLLAAQQALADFQAETGLINVGDTTLITRQLAELSASLIAARTRTQEAQASYDQVQALLGAGSSIDSIPAVMDSPLIADLRRQAAEVQRRVALLSAQYGDQYPELVSARAELGNIQASIGHEIRSIGLRLERDLALARANEEALQAEVDRLQAQLEEQTGAQAELQRLQDAVNNANQFYQALLTRQNEVGIQTQEAREANARVIEEAVPPEKPAFPNVKLMLAAAVAGSAVIGIVLAMLAEFMDSGFRSMTQVEAMTGAPAIGLMPITKGSLEPHRVVIEKPNSAYGEAVRSLRTALLLSSADRPPRTVCVTSSLPDEGKTSTALSLAVLGAKSGQKVVILDCDLRRPSVHKVLGKENRLGLADYLTGKAPLADVLEIDPETDLHYITAGSKTPNPPELLQSEAMHRLLAELGATYDLVVLDSPPLMAVSDALLLLRRCDKTIYVVRWEKTRRATAIAGVRQAYDAGGDLAGVLLTQVNARKMAQYDYADSGYYYSSAYKKYYADDR